MAAVRDALALGRAFAGSLAMRRGVRGALAVRGGGRVGRGFFMMGAGAGQRRRAGANGQHRRQRDGCFDHRVRSRIGGRDAWPSAGGRVTSKRGRLSLIGALESGSYILSPSRAAPQPSRLARIRFCNCALRMVTAFFPPAIWVMTISLDLVKRWPTRIVYERSSQLQNEAVNVASSMSRHLTPTSPFDHGRMPRYSHTPTSS